MLFAKVRTGSLTISVAVLDVVPLPPSDDEMAPVLLSLFPPVTPTTSTVSVQVPPPTIEPELNVRLVPFAADEKFGAPKASQPEAVAFGITEICNPAGKASENETPLKVVEGFGFVMTNFIVLVPPTRIAVGVKDLTIVGGAITLKVALAVFPFPPLVEVTAPLVFR